MTRKNQVFDFRKTITHYFEDSYRTYIAQIQITIIKRKIFFNIWFKMLSIFSFSLSSLYPEAVFITFNLQSLGHLNIGIENNTEKASAKIQQSS